MSLAARLNRLTPALSGKQRALLVIKANLEGRQPDREWRNMPPEQRREYDYYVALLYTANGTLGTLMHALTWVVDCLERDRELHGLLGAGAKLTEELLEANPTEEDIRKWQRRAGNITLPQFLRGLERDIKEAGVERLLLIWQELGALEVCWQEIAEACDGEDLRHRDLIAQAASTKERLLKLIEDVSPKRRKRLPEPSEEALNGVKARVDEAMRLLGFREPE